MAAIWAPSWATSARTAVPLLLLDDVMSELDAPARERLVELLRSGDGQSVPANTALPAPLVVLVDDSKGTPVAGVPIAFSIAGDGRLSASSVSFCS